MVLLFLLGDHLIKSRVISVDIEFTSQSKESIYIIPTRSSSRKSSLYINIRIVDSLNTKLQLCYRHTSDVSAFCRPAWWVRTSWKAVSSISMSVYLRSMRLILSNREWFGLGIMVDMKWALSLHCNIFRFEGLNLDMNSGCRRLQGLWFDSIALSNQR